MFAAFAVATKARRVIKATFIVQKFEDSKKSATTGLRIVTFGL